MFSYDPNHTPPAPTAHVTFACVDAGPHATRVEGQMLLDTGADVSMIPSAIVDAINAKPTGRTIEVISFDGHKSARPIVAASMHLGKYKMDVEFLVHDEGETIGIIGRNILNLLYIVLDGPTGIWSVGRTGPVLGTRG